MDSSTYQSGSIAWCDEKGFGPFVDGTNSLTMCFCATVFELPSPLILALFGIPSLIRLSHEPFVNPASSWSFSLKLGLSAAALFCSMLLAMFGEPTSPANTWSQSLSAAGWLLSILILVTGYLRAQPQLMLLRFWWLAQFISSAIVFINHARVESSEGAHIIRGVSLLCVALLACLSFYSHDVPEYKEIVAPSGASAVLFRSPNNGTSNSVHTPLLAPRTAASSNGAVSASAVSQPIGMKRFGLHSQLSEATLYGADTSVFKGAISAWDEAVTSSYKQHNGMETIDDDEQKNSAVAGAAAH
jgi:hypothetical protein